MEQSSQQTGNPLTCYAPGAFAVPARQCIRVRKYGFSSEKPLGKLLAQTCKRLVQGVFSFEGTSPRTARGRRAVEDIAPCAHRSDSRQGSPLRLPPGGVQAKKSPSSVTTFGRAPLPLLSLRDISP